MALRVSRAKMPRIGCDSKSSRRVRPWKLVVATLTWPRRTCCEKSRRIRVKKNITAQFRRRHEIYKKAADKLLAAANKWNKSSIRSLARSRGIAMRDTRTKIEQDFPKKIYLEHRDKLDRVGFDPSALNGSERRFLQCYHRYLLQKLLDTIRTGLAPPSAKEELLVPIVQSFVVLPLLAFGQSDFVVGADEFLPEWSKRPYFITKQVEFCLLSADNPPAAEALDRYLSRITVNTSDDYEGHFEEHMAMIYRRNGMLAEATKRVNAAIDASRRAGLGIEHEIRLRKLLVEGYEEIDEFEEAGRETFHILESMPAGVERSTYQELVEKMVGNFHKADNLTSIHESLNDLLHVTEAHTHHPVLLRQKWLVLRRMGHVHEASELLYGMVQDYPEDEQLARCKLDVAKDCLSAGEYEAVGLITSQIIKDFQQESVAIDAAELRATLESYKQKSRTTFGRGQEEALFPD